MTWPFENDTSGIVKRISNRSISVNRKRNIFIVLTIALASALLSAIVLYGFGVMQETQNPAIAQAVLAHVIWFFDEGGQAIENNPCTLPNLISYADKRVRHDKVVSLSDRFQDLLKRYGTSEEKIRLINMNYAQSQKIEDALIRSGVDIELEQSRLVRVQNTKRKK